VTVAVAHTIYTVGHSTHSFEEFLSLLKPHGVTAVADVRSVPHSRFNPQFSRPALEKELPAAGVAYVFLGKQLGARSDDPSCYEQGRVQYRRLARTPMFREGIERIKKGAESYRVALLCAEKEPLDCHRTILVSRELESDRVRVAHILADGNLESHHDAMLRLLRILGMPPGDLFKSESQLLEEAYAKQEQRIAYVADEAARASEGQPQ